MRTPHLIPADDFCTYHKVEYSFINSLEQMGLIEITTIEQNRFIDTERLLDLEKFVRLHYELDINLEGIEAITHLLQKVQSMQEEINALKNRLFLYEDNK
jgi:hypothetical protein